MDRHRRQAQYRKRQVLASRPQYRRDHRCQGASTGHWRNHAQPWLPNRVAREMARPHRSKLIRGPPPPPPHHENSTKKNKDRKPHAASRCPTHERTLSLSLSVSKSLRNQKTRRSESEKAAMAFDCLYHRLGAIATVHRCNVAVSP